MESSTLIEKHESVVTKEDENSFSPNKSPQSAPSPPSPPQVAIIPKTFAEKVLHKLDFAVDGGPLCQDFVKGNLSEAYQDEPTDELQMQYFQQCLRSLEWSFTDNLIKGPTMLGVYAAAIEEMNNFVKHAMTSGLTEQEIMREKLPLDSAPFKYAKKLHLNIQELHKDDEIRIAFQALFLFVLRLYIPIKYETIDSFLEKYPELKERNTTEQERLRNTANWMDLAFYTIQPRNNKTFILNLIPRIVEGKTARYITGSGQTKPTTDRVNLFRSEGNCEKIKRPPRRKKEEILMANAAKLRGDNRTMVDGARVNPAAVAGMDPSQLQAFQKYYENSQFPPMPFPPFLLPYYTPGMIPPKDLQRMKAWQQSGGSLPLDGRRVATYQDQNASDSSYDSTNMSERNYPWYPSSAGGGNMPPGMANYYSDYLQSQRMPRGGSAPYFHPFEYERYRFNPQYPPLATNSSSASNSPYNQGGSYMSGGSVNDQNQNNVAAMSNLNLLHNFYPNFPTSTSQSNSTFPSSSQHPPSIFFNQNNFHDANLNDLSSTDNQPKRRKSSGSPISTDINNGLRMTKSIQIPTQPYHHLHPFDDDHHMRSSASTSASEGGLDVLLAVAGSMDESPKETIK